MKSKAFRAAVTLALLFISLSLSVSVSAFEKDVIRGGWYPWKPYQYLQKINDDRRQLTGLDVQLFKEVFEEELGLTLQLPQVDWGVHQEDIRLGVRDVAGGAFITPERARYAYFSAPYRSEDIVLISRRSEQSAVAMLHPEILSSRSSTASFVWVSCQGITTVSRLITFLRTHLKSTAGLQCPQTWKIFRTLLMEK